MLSAYWPDPDTPMAPAVVHLARARPRSTSGSTARPRATSTSSAGRSITASRWPSWRSRRSPARWRCRRSASSAAASCPTRTNPSSWSTSRRRPARTSSTPSSSRRKWRGWRGRGRRALQLHDDRRPDRVGGRGDRLRPPQAEEPAAQAVDPRDGAAPEAGAPGRRQRQHRQRQLREPEADPAAAARSRHHRAEPAGAEAEGRGREGERRRRRRPLDARPEAGDRRPARSRPRRQPRRHRRPGGARRCASPSPVSTRATGSTRRARRATSTCA